MKNGAEFTIELPEVGDEIFLAPMHIQSWKETYVPLESALTDAVVDEMLNFLLEDTFFRKNTIQEALAHPEKVLYRVVKNANGDIVGFLHGSKHEKYNELEAIYLLNEAKGLGIGGSLMKIFMDWIDKDKSSRLEVFSSNDSAIGFYVKYGFVKTDKEMEPYNGILPVTEMVRAAG